MIATETAKTIFLVLLGLSLVWVIACIIRKDMETIIRALIVTIIAGLGFFYLNQTKLQMLSFKAVKNDLFPSKPEYYSFQKRVTTVGYVEQTTYIFADPGPHFYLQMEEGGKYLSVKDVEPLNRVLTYVGLPPVKKGVRELASITGSNRDVDIYRWDDYDLGVLIIERGICRNAQGLESFPCISTITVRGR